MKQISERQKWIFILIYYPIMAIITNIPDFRIWISDPSFENFSKFIYPTLVLIRELGIVLGFVCAFALIRFYIKKLND